MLILINVLFLLSLLFFYLFDPWTCCLFLCGAVFFDAIAFNQNVSKWKTGKVESMSYSKSLSSLLWCLVFLKTTPRTSSFLIRSIFSHVVCFVLFLYVLIHVTCKHVLVLLLELSMCCCCWFFSFFFCGTPLSFAVFHRASVFNQNVSHWNTGNVEKMDSRKSLSPSTLCCLH